MSILTRVVTAAAVLSVAAIPVGALTVKNTSDKEVTFAVDNGAVESVYKVAPGGSADVSEDCSANCALTGPWGYSRLVDQNAVITTDGASLVTATAAPEAQGLVPQNPAVETADPQAAAVEAADKPAEAAAPAPATAKVRRPKLRYVSKKAPAGKGPSSGSLQMLFQGPGK